MSALSANNVWAVGDSHYANTNTTVRLILHWDGKSWSQVTSPNPSAGNNDLSGVTAESSTDAWAVGDYQNDTWGPSVMSLGVTISTP